jgi:putative tricarboxylic transport membrane protein
MDRRAFVAGATTLTASASVPVFAQEYKPTKPIDMVVHSGPGAGPDAFARAFLSAMEQEKLAPVRVQINHKIGGGGATAMSYIVEKKGDPSTVGLFTSVWIANPLVQAEMKNSIKDMTTIVRLVIEPAVFAVRAESPYTSLAEIVEAAKKNPGQIKQSGGSPLARDAIVRHVLMAHTGARWNFISFPTGAERVSALLGGHVDMMIIEPSEAGEMIRAGKMRALAQISEKRLEGYGDVPTLKEAGFDVPHVPQMRGFVGPPEMPKEAVKFYEDLFEKVAKSPTWQKYLAENQFEDAFARGADAEKHLDGYTDRLREILKGAGMKVIR